MPVRLVTPPASEPLTLAEAKAHLRLDTALDDDYVTSLIAGARHYVEQVSWRGVLPQTWELVLPGFLGADRFELGDSSRRNFSLPVGYEWSSVDRGYRFLDYLELPRGETSSLTSVKYIDPDGVQQTLDPSVTSLDNITMPARLRLAYGQSWPMTRDQWDAVRIQYVVGWASASAVPMPVKQAMLLIISQLYENRTPEVATRALQKVDFSVDALLQPYRLVRL